MAKTVLRSMFDKPATLMYPVVEREYTERTRGKVDIDVEQCILCGLCGRRCPAKAIETKRNTGEWIIHRMRCIQCGECIDVCPKECLDRNNKYTEPGLEKVVDVFEVTAVKKEGATLAGAGIEENLACDLELCVFCGLCAKNCPVDALKVDRKEKIWEVDEEACVKCGACIDKCPKKCLDFEKAGTEKPAPADEAGPETAEPEAAAERKPSDDMLMCNVDECIFCGLCARNCPCDALTVDRKEKIWKVDEEACVKCEACIDKCPKECLYLGRPDDEAEEASEEPPEIVEEAEAAEPEAAQTEEAEPETAQTEDAEPETAETEAAEPEAAETESVEAEAAEPEAAGTEVAEAEAVAAEAKAIPVLEEEKCLYCRLCENECPEEAIIAEMDDWSIDASKCISCRVCIGVCPAEALKMSHEIED